MDYSGSMGYNLLQSTNNCLSLGCKNWVREVWWLALQFPFREVVGFVLNARFWERNLCSHTNRLFPRHISHLTKAPPGLSHCWCLLDLAGRDIQMLGMMDKYMIFNYGIIWIIVQQIFGPLLSHCGRNCLPCPTDVCFDQWDFSGYHASKGLKWVWVVMFALLHFCSSMRRTCPSWPARKWESWGPDLDPIHTLQLSQV